MTEELVRGEAASEVEQEPQPETMPEADADEKLVPESQLRSLQSKADRRAAELEKKANRADAELAAARQRLAAYEATVQNAAHQMFQPEDATQFVQHVHQQRRRGEENWHAEQGKKLASILEVSEKTGVPFEEFREILSDPYASFADANTVVMDYHQRETDRLKKELDKAMADQEQAIKAKERQVRKEVGADKIGSPEPDSSTKDTTNLRAEYVKDYRALVKRAAMGDGTAINDIYPLKMRYVKLGLEDFTPPVV
jgi:hypothetical protein